jgi:hypothetical protein
MFNSTPNTPALLKIAAVATCVTAFIFSPLALAHEGHEHPPAPNSGAASGKESTTGGSEKTLTGEVVDLICYIDHNSTGEKHAACAAKCIKEGGPVGLLTEGKAYIIVGDHKPMNAQLIEHAGKTITLKGKVAERGGLAMIENAEIVKK